MTHYWRIRTKLPERYGQHCRIVSCRKGDAVEVEFADGFRVIASKYAVRRLPGGAA